MRHSRFIAAAILGFALAGPTAAQTYPSRPIELVVHTSPGGGTDVVARLVADILTREKIVTQPINVSNRAGGGGAIAYTYIRSKRGDPHVVMTVASMAMLSQAARPDMKLGLENYTPVAFLASDPQAVLVPADSPYKTLRELLEAGKREPNPLVASHTSPGGTGRMLVWMLEKETGAKFKTVANKSGADALMQVMGGHTHFSTENISEGYSAVTGKKLRVLAVTSRTRLPVVPDAPTLIELGYNIHVGTGRGFALPADVPPASVDFWEKSLRRVYESPAWKEQAERNMYENIWMGRADYAKHLKSRLTEVQEFFLAVGLAK